MKKKVLALLLCGAMAASMAACGNTATSDETPAAAGTEAVEAGTEAETVVETGDLTPEEKLAGGYFGFTRDVGFAYDNFFHFYESGTVYVGFAVNQITAIYTYDVVEEEKAYSCYADGTAMDNEELTEGTAPYTINFYDYNTGDLVDSCAYDGDVLYNDMAVITFQGAGPAMYNYDADPTTSALADSYAAEAGITLLSAVSPDDETSTIALYHTGRYLDMVNFMIEGTYTKDGDVYTLTPDSDSDSAATVTVNGDGTCTYAPEGGDEVVLNVIGDVSVLYTYAAIGAVDLGDNGTADLFIEMNSDNTVRVYVTAFGTEMDIDDGTYEITDTYAIVLHCTNAGDITGADYGGAVQYVQAGTSVGDIDAECTMYNPVLGTYTGALTVSDMPATLSIVLYQNDSSYTATVSLDGMDYSADVDAGTYTISDTYAITLTSDLIGEITGEDYTGELEYVAAGVEGVGDIDVVCTFATPE